MEKDLEMNISDEVNGKKIYQKKVSIFLQKYKVVLETNGQTSKFVSRNIDTLLDIPTLSGEALHLFIDHLRENKMGIPVGRLLKEVFYVNMIPEENPFSLQDINLKLIDGLETNGLDYLTKALVEYGEGRVLYNSIVKFMLAYNSWKVKEEREQYIREMDYCENSDDMESGDPDILYWLDVQDGEISEVYTSPPSEQRYYDDDGYYEYETYENKEDVKDILEHHMDTIMESDLFTYTQKLNLVQLYAKSIERVKINSTMVFGQLKLVYEQLKMECIDRGISEKNITSKIMQFYKGLASRRFSIVRVDLSEYNPKCAFDIFAEVKDDIIYKISAHKLKSVEENHPYYDTLVGDFHSKSFLILINNLMNLSNNKKYVFFESDIEDDDLPV